MKKPVHETEKLQKVIAGLGITSRRKAEELIAAGRVSVNRKTATLGCRVCSQDAIHIDGHLVQSPRRRITQKTRVLLYHKPEDEICSREDEAGRKTVFQRLPRLQQGRWIQIGRLDVNTSGVLLFTNNGELAHQLMHPSSQIEREYAVRVYGTLEENTLSRLRGGVKLDDGPAHFKRVKDAGGQGRNHWYHVILTEGRNREVRRLWEAVGMTVSRLVRIRFANIALPRGLRPGRFRDLTADEMTQLRKLAQAKAHSKSE